MKTYRAKALTVGAIFAVDIACLVVFMGILGWI